MLSSTVSGSGSELTLVWSGLGLGLTGSVSRSFGLAPASFRFACMPFPKDKKDLVANNMGDNPANERNARVLKGGKSV